PNLIRALPDLHRPTTLLAVLGLALLIVAPRLPLLKHVPGPLTAMVAVTVLSRFLDLDGVATIRSTFGGIPTGLPSLAPPEISANMIVDLIGPAFTIAMLGAI